MTISFSNSASLRFCFANLWRTVKTLSLAALLLILPGLVMAAPASTYWAFWDKSNPESSAVINHHLWQEILDTYLALRPGGNRFRYGLVSQEDRDKLDKYLTDMATLDPRTYSLAEQKAYWINVYNALTVDLVLEHYPVKSITKIGPWYQFGPWDMDITQVAGQNLTLNDIEHRILRPLWDDSRIHYAVNCASIGCPDLSPTVFTADNTEPMLDELARRFIRQEKGMSWVEGKLTLSRIYEWYEQDFVDQAGVVLHLRQFASQANAQRLKKYTGTIQYQYDWRLNELK
ncbi:DUF547 domain-containing protein [Endozoicomonas sp. GU-1]|uniref:DUF547 domain-containing protein n=1 Tax=Endozoicomonas sp. GU-1 TaxID=3009078 RepID=UPI0022B4EFFF|nr:DUF547 domain-containing protein [Endozoicomonas sp. GU-1]WBA80313.1 DUF547 domain-containing protein [Endozoicomonas sp. GU-1]WBA87884.1 DUF547 domain-containing protein [Endozoicomonas sp. GU-1]